MTKITVTLSCVFLNFKIIAPDFSKVFVAHFCLGSQTTSPRLFPPVSEN